MRSYLVAFLLALFVTLASTPLVARVALRLGAVHRPRRRDVHLAPIPRLGGCAIALGVCAPIVALLWVDRGVAVTVQREWALALGLLGGGALNVALGCFDDLRGVRAAVKLLVQVLAATVAFASGYVIGGVSLPFLGVLDMGIFAYPVTILWIVGITNAVNLIDGLDGLAGGVVFFAGITNLTVALIQNNVLLALVMACVLGAVLGFLVFNRNPARIFMGDSGSYFLGFVLAVTSLAGAMNKATTTVALLAPVVALGLPIFDTTFAVVRRWVEGRPLFSADRSHVHHRLLAMGLTQRRAVLVLYSVCVVLTVSAIAVSFGRSWEIGAALAVATLVMIGLVRFVGYFEYLQLERRAREPAWTPRTTALRAVVPDTLAALRAARGEADVAAALEGLVSRGGLLGVSLHAGGAVTREWGELSASAEATDAAVVCPLAGDGLDGVVVRFRWGGAGEVAPQEEILLELVADGLSPLVATGVLPLARSLARAEEAGAGRLGAGEPGPRDVVAEASRPRSVPPAAAARH